ncbi:hypothetical protein [Corynebacterium cystitidis]|uniref:hypothetical protein n=1 Tax=Corynebacterium cystitidis TaxID=35757 RepID=UPI00211E7CF7|nr:hypothetical protein [Corynebacterium cystitidis]
MTNLSHRSLSKKLKTGIISTVVAPALFLAGCADSDNDNSASQADETAAAESAEESSDASDTSETETTSAEESEATTADGLTAPGTKLKLGEAATVMTEDTMGNLLTWELTVNEPVEKSVEDVHAAAGQEIADPEDGVENFICVPYTMTLKEVEQVGEDEPLVVVEPEIKLTDDRGYPANTFMLIGGGEEIVCDIDAVDVTPNSLRDVQIDRPYQYAELSYVSTEGGVPATAATFEYNLPSNSELTPSDPISWR